MCTKGSPDGLAGRDDVRVGLTPRRAATWAAWGGGGVVDGKAGDDATWGDGGGLRGVLAGGVGGDRGDGGPVEVGHAVDGHLRADGQAFDGAGKPCVRLLHVAGQLA